ncbi:MAG: class I SAM-dependent methyltransferase [Candidatus Dormibacteraceae bacterium]
MNRLDPVSAGASPDVDPAAAWSRLVEERAAQIGGARPPDFWDRRAAAYRTATEGEGEADPFLAFMEPFCRPRLSLIDVGAGAGRHTTPLAARLDWVTAVEPSQGMRESIPLLDNVTIVASTWEDAEVAVADLVICCHVLYSIREPIPFIEKLEMSARERVFVQMRDGQLRHPAERIWEELSRRPRSPQPEFGDLCRLLRRLGVEPELAWLRRPLRQRFSSLEQALEDCRLRVGDSWDETVGRAWLEAHLEPDGGDALVHRGGEMVSGVAHWEPRTPSA